MKYHLAMMDGCDGKNIELEASNLQEAQAIADLKITKYSGRAITLSEVNGDGPVERLWHALDDLEIAANNHPIEFLNGFYSDWEFGELARQAKEAKKRFDDLNNSDNQDK